MATVTPAQVYAMLGGAHYARRVARISDRNRTLWALGDLCKWAREDLMAHNAVYTAAYGLAWTLETGRTDGQRHFYIIGLRVRDLCALVAEIAGQCETIGSVPYYVNGHVIVEHMPRPDGLLQFRRVRGTKQG